MSEVQHFFAQGKLLLSGEYAVLDGATSLAIPTRYGQRMELHPNPQSTFVWKSYNYANDLWLEIEMDLQGNIRAISDDKFAERSTQIVGVIKKMKGGLLPNVEMRFYMDFPNDWGLGSSSTLIALMAQYFDLNAQKLSQETFGGSGYDIACATANSPIFYNINQDVEKANFQPDFLEDIYFIHLNQKQDSREGIQAYRKVNKNKKDLLTSVSNCSIQMCQSEDLKQFEYAMELHETLISEFLEIKKVKDVLFADYTGVIKSLGAWGGDFVMATRKEALTYFPSKGYDTVIPYNNMVFKQKNIHENNCKKSV